MPFTKQAPILPRSQCTAAVFVACITEQQQIHRNFATNIRLG